MILTIEKQKFPLQFGFKCISLIGKELGLKTFDEVIQKYAQFDDDQTMTFEKMELIELLVKSAVYAHPGYAKSNLDIESVPLMDSLMSEAVLQDLLTNFENALRKPENEKKQKAQKSAKPKKNRQSH